MFFKSVRFKIILLYIVILTITLSAFSLLIYGNFSKKIYDDLDDLLSSRAEGVANALNTYYQLRKIEAAQNGKEFNFLATDGSGDFVKVARNWVEAQRKDPEMMSVFVQIADPAGNIIVSSKTVPHIQPLSKEDFRSILGGEDSFDTVDGEAADGGQIKFRLYSKPIMEGGQAIYVVQTAGPISMLSIALNNLRFTLFVLLPLTVLLAGLPGIFLVRVALNPIDKMINTLKQITAENLRLKIHIPDTKDEMSRLADTFNDLIERLDRSFSSQQDFMHSISHELETPIEILRKEIERALKNVRSSGEYQAVLQAALKEIGGFSKTVEDLLALTRLADGRLLLEIKKVDLTKLIEEELNEIRVLAEDKDIDISFYCEETIILDGDGKQLKRLLTNIFDNAIKYTLRKGRVIVTVRKEGKDANITVSDTGVGMPEDEIPYIFDRFYQIKKSRRTKSGFGLGLSTVKAIVEAHRGKISVESRVGQGSSFIIHLPLSYPV
ncbi:MAG: ATP-binding protein [Candidatus Omnitrophica bacterium]|nr:ATP-binding protein [Candidatus Omnitrophota bacterium]